MVELPIDDVDVRVEDERITVKPSGTVGDLRRSGKKRKCYETETESHGVYVRLCCDA